MSDDIRPAINPLRGVFSAVESLFARKLAASTAARTRLAKLAGKTLALELTGVGMNVYVHCAEDAVQLSSEFSDDADVIISGTPFAMLAFARSDPQDGIRGGSVKFTGDVGVAQDFQLLFAALSPDFEEELSRLVGDEAAYRVSTAIKDLVNVGKRAVESLTQGISAHLTEGGRDVPTQDELNDFLEEVDRLRADIERAEARLNRTASGASS
ncbi:MAG: SCP2 sterol-binding domain-containing protein [Pseudomonadota bacterium]